MANILTATEASNVLRCSTTDPLMLNLLGGVDRYLEMATGRDWAADTAVYDEAKSAARMLLVMWHENPAMIGKGEASLTHGLAAALTQLEALALQLATGGVPEGALVITATVPPDGYTGFAITANPVLVFSNQMDAGATAAVVLKDASGETVASTNTLDVTGKILTVNPTASLATGAAYKLTVDAAPDVYGQTIVAEISFTTAGVP